MKPVQFKYHAPTRLAEALELVATLENAKVLAGGQSLMPMMNFRYAMPDHLIDLNGIAELAGIEQRGNRLSIGAMTRQQHLYASPLVRKVAPLIPEAYSHVAHRQVRNRGTYGGSLCHLDPSSEQPCFSAALDAEVEVASRKGRRRIPMAQWATNYMTPALADDELMTGASLAIWPEGHGWAFEEYARRHGDYAIVGVAVLVELAADQRISRFAIALCGVAAAPVRLASAEGELSGASADEAAATRAGALAAQLEDIMEDAHYTADYRRHLAKVLTVRAMRTALGRARRTR